MLEDRRSEVLRALVEEHIKTGEPVSSRAIVAQAGLSVSAATVRHDLAALEEEGLAVQPHTSAGRIPTSAAYRYYVDHLGPRRLRQNAQTKVTNLFGEVHLELTKLLKATSDLLAEITDLPSVVIAPGVTHDRLRSLHTVQVGTDQILVIAVTEGGRVVQQRGRVRVPVTPREVEDAQGLLAEVLVGEELGSQPEPPKERLQAVSEPVRETALTIVDCLHLASTAGTEMFVAGAARMADMWEDLSSMQRILEILEREAEVIRLVATASGTSIQLGSELNEGDLDLAVVSKTYDASGESGSVGVIGPMRMNYRHAISAVEEITRELEERIGRTED
ncbi:MAG: heat-inducible transcriptional repressor HrcA [Acidimicrobiia bacterium]